MLPKTRGMQVHEEYSLYGHFLLLKGLLRRAEKLRFFLEQDSGMRAACCFAPFASDIRLRRVDACYVRATKDNHKHVFRVYQATGNLISVGALRGRLL